MPLFQGHGRYLQIIDEENRFQDLIWVMESLLGRDGSEVLRRFGLMFHSVCVAVDRYLEELSRDLPKVPPLEEDLYSWSAERGRDHYYTQLARALIHQIGTGVYPLGSFLPAEAVLSEQYGVCVTTVRKALSMLNQLGIVRTYNAKGTQVILPDGTAMLSCLKNKTYKRDTLVYLSGAHLMVIAIQPATLLAYQSIDGSVIHALQMEAQKADDLLPVLFRCVIDHIALPPLLKHPT